MSEDIKGHKCNCCGMKCDNMTALFRHIKTKHMDNQPEESQTVTPQKLTIEQKQAQNIGSLFDKCPSLQKYKKGPGGKSQAVTKAPDTPFTEDEVIMISDDNETQESEDDSFPAGPRGQDQISEENLSLLQEFVVEMDPKDPAHIGDISRRLNIKQEVVEIWLGHIVISSEFPPGSIMHKLPEGLNEDTRIELLNHFKSHPYPRSEQLQGLSKKLGVSREALTEWHSHQREVCKKLCQTIIENRSSLVGIPVTKENKLKNFLKLNPNPSFASYETIAKSIQWSILDVVAWCKKCSPVIYTSKKTDSPTISSRKKKPKFGSQRKLEVRQFLANHPQPTKNDRIELSEKLGVSPDIVYEWVSIMKETPVQEKSLNTTDKLALRKIYRENPSPSAAEKQRLALKFAVPFRSIVMWFIHQDKKNLKERDGMVSGTGVKENATASHHKNSTATGSQQKTTVSSFSLEVLNQFYNRCNKPTETDVEQLSNVLNIHPDAVKIYFNQVRCKSGQSLIHWRTDKSWSYTNFFSALDQLYSHTKEPTVHDINRLANLFDLHKDAVQLYINHVRHIDGLEWIKWDPGSDQTTKPIKTVRGISASQRSKLVQFYRFKKCPSEADFKNIAASVGTVVQSVKMWFYHHRRQLGLNPELKSKGNIKRGRGSGKLTAKMKKILTGYYAEKKYPTEEDFKSYMSEFGVSAQAVKLFFYYKREQDGLVQLKQTRPKKKMNCPQIKTEPDLPLKIKEEHEDEDVNTNQEATVCVTSLCGMSPAIHNKLKSYYKAHQKPSKTEIELLAKELKMATRLISAWFVKERSNKEYVSNSSSGVDENDSTSNRGMLEYDTESTVSVDSVVTHDTLVKPHGDSHHVSSNEVRGPASPLDKLDNNTELEFPGIPLDNRLNELKTRNASGVQVNSKQETTEQGQAGGTSGGSIKKITPRQREMLTNMYEMNPNTTTKDMENIAEILGLSRFQVFSWWSVKKKQCGNGMGAPKQVSKKRRNSELSPEQENVLRLKFSANSNPSIEELELISMELGLQEMVVLKWYHKEKIRLKLQPNATQPLSSTTVSGQPSLVAMTTLGCQGISTTYPPLMYASSQTDVFYSSASGSVQSNLHSLPQQIMPGFSGLSATTSHQASNIIQIDPQLQQYPTLSGPNDNHQHIIPKIESNRETEILVPLHKVARVAPFEGSVKKFYESPEDGSDFKCEDPFNRMVEQMNENLRQNKGALADTAGPSHSNLVPVGHPRRIPGASTSLYPASSIPLPNKTNTLEYSGSNSSALITISPDLSLDTQIIRIPQGKQAKEHLQQQQLRIGNVSENVGLGGQAIQGQGTNNNSESMIASSQHLQKQSSGKVCEITTVHGQGRSDQGKSESGAEESSQVLHLQGDTENVKLVNLNLKDVVIIEDSD